MGVNPGRFNEGVSALGIMKTVFGTAWTKILPKKRAERKATRREAVAVILRR